LNYYSDNNCNFDSNYHFSKLNDASNYYYNFFNKIKSDNNQIIYNLDMTTQNYLDIQSNYSTVLDALKNTTKYAIILTGSIANAYNAILGNGQFNQLLDCGFIKDDLNILLNELHSKLANSLIKFGTTFCIISCLIAIGICMMLLNLTLSNESKEEKKKVYNKNRKNVINKYQNNEVNSERMILKENK
jgi:lipoprotein signal peptidase